MGLNRHYRGPAAAALALLLCGVAPVASKPPPAHPAIEPAALDILKAASTRLVNAKSFSFTAINTYESPALNGQPLYYMTRSEVSLLKPNFLRVITPGDGPASDFTYNGSKMSAYSPADNLLAVAAAPATMDGMLKAAYDLAAIYFPFSDVIVADPYKDLSAALTSAFVVGQSHVVDDTVTDMVAIANTNVQAEIWIGVDDGLPRMVRATYVKDPAHLRYTTQMTNWRINPKLEPADFAIPQPAHALLMQFARPDRPAAETAK